MGPFFLIDKNQSYTESKERLPDGFTREFESEIKNEVISPKAPLPLDLYIVIYILTNI